MIVVFSALPDNILGVMVFANSTCSALQDEGEGDVRFFDYCQSGRRVL